MTLSFISYAVVCVLVFLAGFIDAIAGGGGLISLPAYMMTGMPAHLAVGTNKLSSALGTVVSTARYIKKGFVIWKIAVPSAVLSIIGSTCGANLALMVDGKALTYIMLVILPLTAAAVFLKKDIETTHEVPQSKMMIVSLGAALLIGMYDGFYGPGTGTFMILALTGLAGMNAEAAAGNTKIMNLSSNIAALVTFIINGKILYPLGLAAAVFSILGHYTGSSMVISNGKKIMRPAIIIVLIIMIVKILWEQF